MANFWESIDALKKAGSADSKILEIMYELVDKKCLQKTRLSLKSPVMNFLLKTMMLLLKHPQSIKGTQAISALKNNPKP